MRNRISVIGLGNILLQDEGVGVHTVRALKRDFDFPEQVTLIDGGTLGLDLLPYVEGMEKVLFVDALELKKEPGTIAVLEDAEIPATLRPAFSFHQVGLADLLFASTFMGMNPPKTVLVGIQPERIETGLALSETLEKNFGKLLQIILEKLREWGVAFTEKPAGERADVPGHSI